MPFLIVSLYFLKTGHFLFITVHGLKHEVLPLLVVLGAWEWMLFYQEDPLSGMLIMPRKEWIAKITTVCIIRPRFSYSTSIWSITTLFFFFFIYWFRNICLTLLCARLSTTSKITSSSPFCLFGPHTSLLLFCFYSIFPSLFLYLRIGSSNDQYLPRLT